MKYFLMESFSLYIHIFSRSYTEKKLWDSKNSENCLFQKSHPIKKRIIFLLFFYFCYKIIVIPLVLKIQVSKLIFAIEFTKLSVWPQKCVFLKRL